jgi:hypothetical protein
MGVSIFLILLANETSLVYIRLSSVNLTGHNMSKPRIFSVTVPPDLYEELREYAFERDEKLAVSVRRMIRDCLKKVKRK